MMCYEIKFKNCVQDKNNFFIKRNIFFLEQKYILFLETHFFKIPKNLITSAHFSQWQILKHIDMSWQKPLMPHW